MSFPRFPIARAFDFVNYQGGNYSLTSATWTAVDSTNLDVTIIGNTDDVIELGISSAWGNQATVAYLDVATIVSSSIINWAGDSGGNASNGGIIGWYGAASAITAVSGSYLYRLDAADISDDSRVQLRLMYRASGTKTLYASSTDPFQFYARNLGPSL